jgi:hypothetical protein
VGSLAAVAARVAVALVGVVRRWHPLIRVGLYVALAGVVAGAWVIPVPGRA